MKRRPSTVRSGPEVETALMQKSVERARLGRATRSTAAVAPIVFAFVCVEAAVSILARWPYQFTGEGNPDRMLQDFLYAGTLLAPPLPLLLMFGATALLVRRKDRLGVIATIAMIAICAVMAVGSLGEALAPASPDVPRTIQLSGGCLGALLFAGLLTLAFVALLERRSGAALPTSSPS